MFLSPGCTDVGARIGGFRGIRQGRGGEGYEKNKYINLRLSGQSGISCETFCQGAGPGGGGRVGNVANLWFGREMNYVVYPVVRWWCVWGGGVGQFIWLLDYLLRRVS